MIWYTVLLLLFTVQVAKKLNWAIDTNILTKAFEEDEHGNYDESVWYDKQYQHYNKIGKERDMAAAVLETPIKRQRDKCFCCQKINEHVEA